MVAQLETDRAVRDGKPLNTVRLASGKPAALQRTRWALVVGVAGIGAIFLARWLSPAVLGTFLPTVLQDLLTLAYSVIIESLPFVVLGIALSILVQVWIPDRWIARALPKNTFLRRLAISFLGVLLPVCECGNLPFARGLIARGFSVSESLTFLLAAPIINPITILTTYQAFGLNNGVLVARLAGGFFVGQRHHAGTLRRCADRRVRAGCRSSFGARRIGQQSTVRHPRNDAFGVCHLGLLKCRCVFHPAVREYVPSGVNRGVSDFRANRRHQNAHHDAHDLSWFDDPVADCRCSTPVGNYRTGGELCGVVSTAGRGSA